jgi:hypothetical protein
LIGGLEHVKGRVLLLPNGTGLAPGLEIRTGQTLRDPHKLLY